MLTSPAASHGSIGAAWSRTPVATKASGLNLGAHLSSAILAAIDEKNVGGKLLEVGCGNGALAEVLAAVPFDVVALDKSLGHRSPRPGPYRERSVRYVAADFEQFEFDRHEKFDVLVCSFAAHHFEIDTSLAKMKALLRSRGEIIIVDLYAEHRTNLFVYLIDQLVISQFNFFRRSRYSRTRIRVRDAIRFYRDRVRFMLRSGGIEHVIEDLQSNRPPTLQTWRNCFDYRIPNGHLSVLAGSVFMYRWQARPTGQLAPAE